MLTRLSATAYMARHLWGQAQYPYKPLEQIRLRQSRRVRAMIEYAYRFVPYYRETMRRLGVCPADFARAEDLRRLPLIEREQLQRDPEYFVSEAQPMDRYLRVQTAGTTGAPRTVYIDARALYLDAAHGGRERAMISQLVGRPWAYRKTMIVSIHSTALRVQQFHRDHSLFPRGLPVRRQTLSIFDAPALNVRRINEFKPDVLHSYGSYLEALFGYLQTNREPLYKPKVITYTSDTLSAVARRRIEGEFGIPVLGTYETVESLKAGFECRHHTGVHLNIDLCPLYVADADGNPLPMGASGEVVVSNLVNRATVLLNYRLGDIAALLPDQCPCGRSLPLLSDLQGRSDDWIELDSGELAHPQLARVIVMQERDIWQYQIVQHSPGRFSVSAVAAPACDCDVVRRRVTAAFERTFGAGTHVDVRFVDALPRQEGGKVRAMIRQRAQLASTSDAPSANEA